jgi:hypothetical protein
MAFQAKSTPVKTLKGSIDTDQQAMVMKITGDPDGGAPGTLVRDEVPMMLKAIVDGFAQFTAD